MSILMRAQACRCMGYRPTCAATLQRSHTVPRYQRSCDENGNGVSNLFLWFIIFCVRFFFKILNTHAVQPNVHQQFAACALTMRFLKSIARSASSCIRRLVVTHSRLSMLRHGAPARTLQQRLKTTFGIVSKAINPNANTQKHTKKRKHLHCILK